jgi:hypothetical protein
MSQWIIKWNGKELQLVCSLPDFMGGDLEFDK